MNWILFAGSLYVALLANVGGPLFLVPPIPFIVTLLAIQQGLGKWLTFCALGLNGLLLAFGVVALVTSFTVGFEATWWEIIIALGICLVPTINIVALAGTLRSAPRDIAGS